MVIIISVFFYLNPETADRFQHYWLLSESKWMQIFKANLFFTKILCTVHPPICHTPILQQNPFVNTFFENENVTNRVSGGFQKRK